VSTSIHRRVVVAIATAAAAPALGACHWPVPSCRESDERLEITGLKDVRLDDDGGGDANGFVLGGVHYADCRDYCATKTDVVEVRSCTAPARTSSASYTFVITCNVHKMICTEATILDAPGSGRRPERFTPARPAPSTSPLAAYFAACAELEAASVPAFARLEAELLHHRAPPALVRAARRARADEVRHARDVLGLARRFGHRAPLPEVSAPAHLRALESVAMENAVEGCVRETVGAAVAAVQAARASDPRVRAVMRQIARDEARHAALSWRVHGWALGALAPSSRSRVVASLGRAFDELDPASFASVAAPVASAAGLPNATEIATLITRLRAELAPLARAA